MEGNHIICVQAVLALNDPMDVTNDTSVEEIISRFDARVSYEQMHADCYTRAVPP